jgi:DNA-binding GntR family transcriptional regulator
MPVPYKTKPLSRSCMREEVYKTLLSWILEGELRPGEKLLDKELAETMGISRTPVREAIRRLEDKGLVESSANRWTRVSEVSIREPEKIYPIIWRLEELALVESMVFLTEDDFKAMEKANTRLEKALVNEDPVKASQADIEFHDVFINKSDNQHLMSILRDLKISYRRFEVLYFEGNASAKYSIEEHSGIIEALRKKDLTVGLELNRLNWQNSLARLKKVTNLT